MNVAAQYVVETLVFLVLARPLLRRPNARRVLVVLTALNVLRFGGVAGALGAMRGSPAPHLLVVVAIGDGLTAALAIAALVALLRHAAAERAWLVAMNFVGLAGIVASETGLTLLGTRGLHVPTIGAALFTALHVVALRLVHPHGAPRSVRGAGSATRDDGIQA